MYKRIFYFFVTFVLMVVCQANRCSEHDEEAANGINLKFEGKWCVTSNYDGQPTDMSQHVTAYWDISKNYVYALHESTNGKEATYSDGVLNSNGVEWGTKSAELEVSMTHIELMPYKGTYSFESPNKFILTQTNGQLLVFERINEIK